MIRLTSKARKYGRLVEQLWNLYGLKRKGNPIAESIAHAVSAMLKHEVPAEEKGWIDKIEQLRDEMNRSTERIIRLHLNPEDCDAGLVQEPGDTYAEFVDTVGHVSRVASKPVFGCLLLFRLIRAMQPASCIEMGTCVGISGAYQAAALGLNGKGTLVTIEGNRSCADIARRNFQQLGLNRVEVVVGRFQDALTGVLETRQPVDYVFIDGHHDEHATLAYFEQILPFLAKPALLIFDDIAWSDGMKRAWKSIAQDPRVAVAVDLGPVGLSVIGNSLAGRRFFNIPLE